MRFADALAEIERLLSAAADMTIDAAAPAAVRPRLGAISFLHRFGLALNHHLHLHVCATDGVFMPAGGEAGCCGPPSFLPVRPITQADLATVTERVRRRVIRRLWLALPPESKPGVFAPNHKLRPAVTALKKRERR